MSRKGKLQKFAELNELPNVYQNFEAKSLDLRNNKGEMLNMQGQWKHFFGNDHPITLELGCGKGEYSVGLARMYPERNFIGMDLKGNRLWKGAAEALEQQMGNVGFIRSQIDFIENYFEKEEVSEIWITFSDPHLGKPRKRLTSPWFLPRYKHVLKPGGLVHLKTDSPELYAYTLEMVEAEGLKLHAAHDNIYSLPSQMPEWAIKTFYEQMHLENKLTIKYVRFSFE